MNNSYNLCCNTCHHIEEIVSEDEDDSCYSDSEIIELDEQVPVVENQLIKKPTNDQEMELPNNQVIPVSENTEIASTTNQDPSTLPDNNKISETLPKEGDSDNQEDVDDEAEFLQFLAHKLNKLPTYQKL